jgi:predicted transcriptional regulator
MYQTLLNFRQVSDYCIMLEDAGLLNPITEDRLYSITEKGRSFLRLYDESSKILQQAQQLQ